MLNFGVDDYFTVFNRRHHGQMFPTDVGLTVGLFTWHQLNSEVGIDYLGGADNPFFFNGKVGLPENTWGTGSPALSLGIFGVGTSGKTNFNVVDLVAGTTLPKRFGGGRVFAAAYIGSHTLGRNRAGYMVAYTQGFCSKKDCEGEDYKQWVLVADYASGKNVIGGGGVGITYYFTPRINIITGPTWFNDTHTNGTWKWTIQLNFLLRVFGSEKDKS